MQVSLIAAISLDGFIAPKSQAHNVSTSWTSPEDTRFFNRTTNKIGTVVMGATTYHTIPAKYRPLKDRRNIIYTNHPNTIPEARPLSTITSLPNTTAPLTTDRSPIDLIQDLTSLGIDHIAICGGASIYTLFQTTGCITDYYLTFEPVIFGQGISLFDKPIEARLQLIQSTKLSQNVQVNHYQP